jgi:hypothetical protein
MSSAPQVPGVEIRGEWREGYEQLAVPSTRGSFS